MDDVAGVAMASALRCTKQLQCFQFVVHGTGVTNVTGVAMAGALKCNTGLMRFKFSVCETGVGNVTGVAMACALKHNILLQEFQLDAFGTGMDDETGVAMADALKYNVVLQHFQIYGCSMRKTHAVEQACILRNRAIRKQRHILTGLSRCVADTGFECLCDAVVRCRVMGYFLPPACRLRPIDFVSTRHRRQ